MMRRLIFCILLSSSALALAENNGAAHVPPPPVLSEPGQEKNLPLTKSKPEKPAAVDESGEPLPVPELPEIPGAVQSGENLEPDITIIRKDKETIQEFRHNGALYMVKIIPDFGPAYYLIDTNGDGKLDVQKSDLDQGVKINTWKLLEWK